MAGARAELAAMFKQSLLDKIIWNSVAEQPAHGHITIVAGPGRSTVGIFHEGEWLSEKRKPLSFTPTHWMGFRDE